MITRALFRTDGGSGIGLGHVNRCMSLATALQRRNVTAFFAIHGDESALARTREAGFASVALPDPVSASMAVTLCKSYECEAIIVDSYLIDAAYLNDLREAGLIVISLDDLNEFAFGCQMVVSHGPHAPSAGYASSSGDTRFLLGPRYTILRPEFWETPLPLINERVRNILITSGGADPQGVLPSWIGLIDSIDADFSITAIAGPFFENRDAVHEAAFDAGHMVRVLDAPKVMRPLLCGADIAVIAGGQTTYECCALGVPAIAVEIAPNQRPQLEGFSQAGALVVAGVAGAESTSNAIVACTRELIGSSEQRAELSLRAKALVHRAGALEVAREIISIG